MDGLALVDAAVIHRAVLDLSAGVRLAQVGKVHVLQAVQRRNFGEIARPFLRYVERRMDLVEPHSMLLELVHFPFRSRGDEVEVQMIEARLVALLVGKGRNITLQKPHRCSPDCVLRKHRSL